MKQAHVDVALERGASIAESGRGSSSARLDLCSFSRGVRAFLQELEGGASWWEKIVIGAFNLLVDRKIAVCEAKSRNQGAQGTP